MRVHIPIRRRGELLLARQKSQFRSCRKRGESLASLRHAATVIQSAQRNGHLGARDMWEDKRFRQLVIAVLLVVLALGLMSLVSTALQLIVPLALILGGGFAFYKIVLEGRDKPEAMTDEIAEASGVVDMRADDDLADDDTSDKEIDEDEEARETA